MFILRKKFLINCVEEKKNLVKTSATKLGFVFEFGKSYVRNKEDDIDKRCLCQYCLIWHMAHTHTHSHGLSLCSYSKPLRPMVEQHKKDSLDTIGKVLIGSKSNLT
jgi:hypothetical protein